MKVTFNYSNPALVAGLFLGAAALPSISHAQDTWQLYCMSGAPSSIVVRNSNRYGHELFVPIVASNQFVPLYALRDGQCQWPARGLRGHELSSKLYYQLRGEDVTSLAINRGNPAVLTSQSAQWTRTNEGRTERLIHDRLFGYASSSADRFYGNPIGNQRSYAYSVCVKATQVPTLARPTSNQAANQDVLRVSKIALGFASLSCK